MNENLAFILASVLAADEGRAPVPRDLTRAMRVMNALGDRHVTLDHNPPMAPIEPCFLEALAAEAREATANIRAAAHMPPRQSQEA